MSEMFTELTGEIGVPLPGHPIAGIIAFHNAGGPITIEVRWYATVEAAKIDLQRVADSGIAQGAHATIMERLT